MKKLGLFTPEQLGRAELFDSRKDCVYSLFMDREALWNPATIDVILQEFPRNLIEEADLFLILAECIANAVLHGQAKALGLFARKRSGVLLLSFYQIPPLLPRIHMVLRMATEGKTKDLTDTLPGGMGFPILLRIAKRITVTSDSTRLQLWLRTKG